jgi:hypothetical protein
VSANSANAALFGVTLAHSEGGQTTADAAIRFRPSLNTDRGETDIDADAHRQRKAQDLRYARSAMRHFRQKRISRQATATTVIVYWSGARRYQLHGIREGEGKAAFVAMRRGWPL